MRMRGDYHTVILIGAAAPFPLLPRCQEQDCRERRTVRFERRGGKWDEARTGGYGSVIQAVGRFGSAFRASRCASVKTHTQMLSISGLTIRPAQYRSQRA